MGRPGAPVRGDRVYVGTGATIAGKIRIGDGAKIAANTLVIANAPAGATYMGVSGCIVMRAQKSTLPAVPPVGAGTPDTASAAAIPGPSTPDATSAGGAPEDIALPEQAAR